MKSYKISKTGLKLHKLSQNLKDYQHLFPKRILRNVQESSPIMVSTVHTVRQLNPKLCRNNYFRIE